MNEGILEQHSPITWKAASLGDSAVSVRASAALTKDGLSRRPSSGREVFDLLHGAVSQAW